MKKNNISTKLLLVRIDERQKRIMEDIAYIKGCVDRKVDDDEEWQEIKKKVGALWDFRNRFVGYAAGAGAIASVVFQVLMNFLK